MFKSGLASALRLLFSNGIGDRQQVPEQEQKTSASRSTADKKIQTITLEWDFYTVAKQNSRNSILPHKVTKAKQNFSE